MRTWRYRTEQLANGSFGVFCGKFIILPGANFTEEQANAVAYQLELTYEAGRADKANQLYRVLKNFD